MATRGPSNRFARPDISAPVPVKGVERLRALPWPGREGSNPRQSHGNPLRCSCVDASDGRSRRTGFAFLFNHPQLSVTSFALMAAMVSAGWAVERAPAVSGLPLPMDHPNRVLELPSHVVETTCRQRFPLSSQASSADAVARIGASATKVHHRLCLWLSSRDGARLWRGRLRRLERSHRGA